jgi:hypothetical protein
MTPWVRSLAKSSPVVRTRQQAQQGGLKVLAFALAAAGLLYLVLVRLWWP